MSDFWRWASVSILWCCEMIPLPLPPPPSFPIKSSKWRLHTREHLPTAGPAPPYLASFLVSSPQPFLNLLNVLYFLITDDVKYTRDQVLSVPSMYPRISLSGVSGVTCVFILSPSNELSQKTKIATFVFNRLAILQVLILKGLMAQASVMRAVMQWPCVTSPRHAGSSHHSLPVTKHVSDVD